MKPAIALDEARLRANAQAWNVHAGRRVWAVVKADGYGWGATRLVRMLDDVVAGFAVNDTAEFDGIRPFTNQPILTLADVRSAEVESMLDRGGIPNLSGVAALRAADAWARRGGRRARVRLGIRSAVGWSGVDPSDVPPLAGVLSQLALDVECWTHLTDPALEAVQQRAFEEAVANLRTTGVAVVATDLYSTAPLARGARSVATSARVGIGLFGFRFGVHLDGVASALRVRAPVVSVEEARAQLVGYGVQRAPTGGFLIVVRCGYGDGFPRIAGPERGVLAVGMQYTIVHCESPPGNDVLDLIDEQTDLDALASIARITAHELVVRLGQGHRVSAGAG